MDAADHYDAGDGVKGQRCALEVVEEITQLVKPESST
jgi:hypothetical protein